LFPKAKRGDDFMGLLWIVLVVIVVLALLGFFSRRAW
jgi:Tfp pilus assembly protein PilX